MRFVVKDALFIHALFIQKFQLECGGNARDRFFGMAPSWAASSFVIECNFLTVIGRNPKFLRIATHRDHYGFYRGRHKKFT